MGGQQRRQWRRGHGRPRMQAPLHGRITPASVAGAAAKGEIAAEEHCGSGGTRGDVCGRRAGGTTPSTASGARTAVGRRERHGLRRAGHLCHRGQWYHRRCQGSKPKATSCGLWYERGPATRLSRSRFCCGSWRRRRWRMRPLPARGNCAFKAEPWPDGRGADWHVRRGSSVPRCQPRCRWCSVMWTSPDRAQFNGIWWPRCVATHTPGGRTGAAGLPQGGAHSAGANRRGFEALVAMG